MRFGRNTIRFLDSIINLMVLLLFLAGLTFGGYALWDSRQLYQEAEAEHYEQYRPSPGNTLSFAQLQQLNPDVFGWLTVYGTNIDYPLVQGEDNMAYINTSVTGESLLSGSIFLDYRNQPDFSDFNSLIYGHHMAKQVMFGEIGEFSERSYFEEHQYAKVHTGGYDYGIEFFAFLLVDAYDGQVYVPAVTGEEAQEAYLDYLFQTAMYIRPIDVEPTDHLILLSTCSSVITNGRHILVGKLSTTVYDDPFQKEAALEFNGKTLRQWFWQTPLWIWGVLLLIGIMVLSPVIVKRRKRGEQQRLKEEGKRRRNDNNKQKKEK